MPRTAALKTTPSSRRTGRYNGRLCSNSSCALAWSPLAKSMKPVPVSASARWYGGRCSLLATICSPSRANSAAWPCSHQNLHVTDNMRTAWSSAPWSTSQDIAAHKLSCSNSSRSSHASCPWPCSSASAGSANARK